MIKYVVGFLFDNRGYVALINKNRPEWQRGRLNGIGGHIEDSESPEQAMAREFKEEAGLDFDDWREFCVVKGDGYVLHCLTLTSLDAKIESKTDEKVGWYDVHCLPSNIISQIEWMIPMANHKHRLTATVIHQEPICD